MGDEEAPAAPVPKQVLIVLTSTTAYPDGSPTGFWLGEATHPYFEFVKSGWEVTFASVGGSALADEASLADLDAETAAFWADEEKRRFSRRRRSSASPRRSTRRRASRARRHRCRPRSTWPSMTPSTLRRLRHHV